MRFLFVFVALALLGSPAAADVPEHWSTERAAPIAQQLADKLEEIKDAWRGLPPPQIGQQRRAFYTAKEDARQLRTTARHLASELAAGEGYDATYPIFKRLMSLRNEAAENLRKAGVIPEDVLNTIAAGGDLLFQLQRYYEGEPGGA